MHILVLPSAYPTEDAQIRGSFFKEQAIALNNTNNKVGVVYNETRRITGISFNNLKKFHFQTVREEESGVDTLRLKGWSIFLMRGPLGIENWIKTTIKLVDKYIKVNGIPDIIHVHCGLYAGVAAKLLKDKYNIPYVITEHSSQVLNHKLDEYHKYLIKIAYDNADSLVAVGEKLRSSMKEYTKTSIKVIPNIVNTKNFTVLENNEDVFRFISVANLKKSKRVDLTIRAFAEEFKDKENFELYIVGSGEELKNLKTLALELKVEDKVKFLGTIERKDMPMVLNKAKVFVLPSEFETFGVSYIEALACGLPIIATKCGGPEDFFRDDLGYMIDLNDLEALKKAMRSLSEKINEYNREEISNYVKEKFSSELITKELIELFNEVIGR